MTKSIVQDWVVEQSLRHQGTLLTVIRGSDSWSKFSAEKPLIREMRGLILNPADECEMDHPKGVTGFMTRFPDAKADDAFKAFCDNIDPLPVHYVMHVLHSIEIIAYRHPNDDVRNTYNKRYIKLCNKFHLTPELPSELHQRMTEDRVAKGTVGE